MSTARYVLDTSVAVAWYLPEENAVVARAWQQRILAAAVEAFVPALHDAEFANVLRTYVRRAVLDHKTALEIYAAHLDAPLNRYDPDRTSILATALDYEATAYDAVFIAAALELDARLLTAERTTTPWVVKLGDRAERVSV